MCYFFKVCVLSVLFHAQRYSLSACAKFRTVGALYGAGASLVCARAVYVILGLYDVFSLRKTVEIVVRSVVLRLAIAAVAIAREQSERLKTSRTSVGELHKVVVAVGVYVIQDVESSSENPQMVNMQ